ncbi:hypothetical protein ATCC90586_011577 [Pythium insidiosum]|nr:hypothetical protein ATCC90586_011577 [Pythium insidiosum]
MAAPAPSASAADARHVKLQRFLVMKAYNLRKGKQSLAQQFQPLQQLDAATQRAVLPLDALCAYLSRRARRRPRALPPVPADRGRAGRARGAGATGRRPGAASASASAAVAVAP